MNIQVPTLKTFTAQEMQLVRRTVAKDCNDTEFDLFMHICKHRGLDPLRRHIYAWVFNKDDKNKRQMVPVISQEGQLLLAERMGNYRPDERPPRIDYDESAKDKLCNPLGIVRAEVTLFKFSHGGWHPVAGEAYWDEFAPIIEDAEDFEWVDTGQKWEDSGRPKMKKKPLGERVRKLDPYKAGWTKSPRVMLPKCARMQAARLGWPDDFGGLYAEEELHRAQALDLTPSELAEAGAVQARLEKIGGADAIMFDWCDGNALERVPLSTVAERLEQYIDANKDDPSSISVFQDRNRHALQEFWARSKSDALEIKRRFEAVPLIDHKDMMREAQERPSWAN